MQSRIFIETENLLIKIPTQEDFQALLALHQDKDVMRFIGNGSLLTPEQVQAKLDKDIAHFTKHGFGLGSVFEKNTGKFVGMAGLFHFQYNDQALQIEIGYRLCKEAWGKGYATELSRAIRDWGFKNLPVEKLMAVVDPRNVNSQKVVLKAGLDYIDTIDAYNKKVKLYEMKKIAHQNRFFQPKKDGTACQIPRAKL